MSRRYNKRSFYKSEYGSICGIHPSKLPKELLQEIDLEKLMECLEEDYRVEFIAAERVRNATNGYSALRTLRTLVAPDTNQKYPHLVKAYNEKVNDADLKKGYYRGDYVFWDLLNEDNRKHEIERWLTEKNSVISELNVDFTAAFKYFPIEAEKKLSKIIDATQKNNYYWSKNALINAIHTIPQNKIDGVFKLVQKMPPKVRMHMLGNPCATKEYILSGLRAIAGKTNIPTIKVNITPELLKELPTISRLEAIESIVSGYHKNHKILCPHFNNSDELANILFSSAMRYPDRVEKAVKTFASHLEDYQLLQKLQRKKLMQDKIQQLKTK